MYIFKPNSSDGLDDKLSKPSNNALAPVADGLLARMPLAPVVQVQAAVLAGSSAPAGLLISSIVDAIVIAGVVSNIAVPLTSEYAAQAANESAANNLAGALEAFSKNALSNLADTNFTPVPITSLSENNFMQDLSTALLARDVLVPLASTQVMALPDQQSIVDVSALPATSAPIQIASLTDNVLTVSNSANTNVNIVNLEAPQAKIENFINTGAGTLTVVTAGTNLSSLSLTGNVAFTATAVEVTTGITVSGLNDASDVSLYLVAGASAAQGSSDVITLGNGNDFVLDAGDGQIMLNLGTGSNMVLLTGVGVTGLVNIADHDLEKSDFVAVASNGLNTASALAASDLVTIAGLNNDARGHDTVAFLSDMGASLSWVGHSASAAQVSVVASQANELVNWVSAAQQQASNPHSVAWFQFNGNTYVLESAVGTAGNHVGDTLIKFTGLTQFTGDDGELAFGMLHLAG